MKLSEIISLLQKVETVNFQLPDGTHVPSHFHVTEIGKITKHFIDCGGTERIEEVINFQLWNADDYDHRLHPEKLMSIIELSQQKLQLDDLEIEVEYQADTIGKFGLDFDGTNFILTSKKTDCLAKENCGIPVIKPKLNLADLQMANNCNPGSGCC